MIVNLTKLLEIPTRVYKDDDIYDTTPSNVIDYTKTTCGSSPYSFDLDFKAETE